MTAADVKRGASPADAPHEPIAAAGEAAHYVPAIGDPACVPCTVLVPDEPPFIHADLTVDETGQRILHAPADCRAGFWGYEPDRRGYLGGTWHPASRCTMNQH